MKNTIAISILGGILAAGSLFAAAVGDVTVTLTHAVTVGATTLPEGTYTMTPIETSVGTDFFVVRGAGVNPVVVPVQKVDGDAASKTAVTVSETGDSWKLEKLSIEGQTTAYEFGGK
jgi:hypothetical protein